MKHPKKINLGLTDSESELISCSTAVFELVNDIYRRVFPFVPDLKCSVNLITHKNADPSTFWQEYWEVIFAHGKSPSILVTRKLISLNEAIELKEDSCYGKVVATKIIEGIYGRSIESVESGVD